MFRVRCAPVGISPRDPDLFLSDRQDPSTHALPFSCHGSILSLAEFCQIDDSLRKTEILFLLRLPLPTPTRFPTAPGSPFRAASSSGAWPVVHPRGKPTQTSTSRRPLRVLHFGAGDTAPQSALVLPGFFPFWPDRFPPPFAAKRGANSGTLS